MACDSNSVVPQSNLYFSGTNENKCPKEAKIFFSIIILFLVLIFIAVLYK